MDGSPWASYLADPRYVGFYKDAHFGVDSKGRLDFWLLVNAM